MSKNRWSKVVGLCMLCLGGCSAAEAPDEGQANEEGVSASEDALTPPEVFWQTRSAASCTIAGPTWKEVPNAACEVRLGKPTEIAKFRCCGRARGPHPIPRR